MKEFFIKLIGGVLGFILILTFTVGISVIENVFYQSIDFITDKFTSSVGNFFSGDRPVEVEEINGIWVEKGTTEPFTGVGCDYFEDVGGKPTKSIHEITDGVLNGRYQGFYSTGGISEFGYYKNGVPNGKSVELHQNGKIKREMDFINGKLTGVVKEYFDNGNLDVISPIKDGLRHGIVKVYNEDGYLSSEIPYENGLTHGVSRTYHPNGELMATVEHVDGKREGIGKWYNLDGSLKMKILFKSNEEVEVDEY